MKGKRTSNRIVIGVLMVMMSVAFGVTRQTVEATRLPAASDGERQALLQETGNPLSGQQGHRYDFLSAWPAERVRRLEVWLAVGIRFEGPWASEELDAVLQVLDAFGALYGERRFFELTDAALGLRGDRNGRHLVFSRAPGYDVPAASWHSKSGQIVLNDGIFDREFRQRHYYWGFLRGKYAQPGPGITRREVIIGHELGHVLVDGLRAEAAAEGYSQISLEGLYRHAIPAEQWPHGYARTKENLVTEVALWVLNIDRTPEAARFRADFLATTIAGREWPHHVARSFALASADGAR
ncbi:MAG: hypothetical protein ACP5JG_13475 [Anaerolineae bacterium]